MTREIKFRAWDEINARMLIGKELAVLVVYGYRGEPQYTEDSRRDMTIRVGSHDRPIELMQYTGLKDKNGVEIYEGDVVRYQYPQKQLKNHQQLCRVVYEPKAAAFLLQPNYFEPQVKYLGDIAKSNRQYDTRTYELCEVIGNIYENPELIQK